MFFHWLFIIGTLVLCAIAALPTRAWLGLAGRFRASRLRSRWQRLEAALRSHPGPFSPDDNFLPRGGGLAADRGRGLVFLAEPDGARVRSAILPLAALGAHAARLKVENGFQEHVLEVETPGQEPPLWRLRCPDAELAAAMAAALTGLASRQDERPAPQPR
ncbi:hypothetical protein [Acidocella sp.]|uniref:hypothetical protein n=1 Tax=Acidocella sp. TaxID=50710 RepID=UPI002639D35F|nr:hypothetical protein [Acidocella sp.]